MIVALRMIIRSSGAASATFAWRPVCMGGGGGGAATVRCTTLSGATPEARPATPDSSFLHEVKAMRRAARIILRMPVRHTELGRGNRSTVLVMEVMSDGSDE